MTKETKTGALSPKKLPPALPEAFVSTSQIASLVAREFKRGNIRKLASRVYSTNLSDAPETIVRRNLWVLVAALFPGALIADRTAIENRPAADGSVFLISGKKNPLTLPGIVLRPRRGAAALATDRDFVGGLKLSSRARACLENFRGSRSRDGATPRTLGRQEMEDFLEDLLSRHGPTELNRLRDEARGIAGVLELTKQFKELDKLVGTLLSSRTSELTSPRSQARVLGRPYDAQRLELFEVLRHELDHLPPKIRRERVAKNGSVLPFFEAYFSNYIEGTEFEVAEAEEIIFGGKIPSQRPADAHDILATFRLVADTKFMQSSITSARQFIELLKTCHAQIMGGRPEKEPGSFKQVANRAGSTLFVSPELVLGTLERGFEIQQSIASPFGRAIFIMFLISEVHPFLDGNGRTARIFMNMQLVAAHECRIVIPTAYRENYLSGLRAMSHNRLASTLVRVLDFAQRYTSLIQWHSLEDAKKILEETNAFLTSTEAEDRGTLLRLPEGAREV